MAPDSNVSVLENPKFLFNRRGDSLKSFRQRLRKEQGGSARIDDLDTLLSHLFEIQEEANSATRQATALRMQPRKERVSDMVSLRDRLSRLWCEDTKEPWKDAPAVLNYALEVMLDVEAALLCLVDPALQQGRYVEIAVMPAWASPIVDTANILWLVVVGGVAFYLLSVPGSSALGWGALAYLGWLVYRSLERRRHLSALRERWHRKHALVVLCRDEVASGCFDPAEIARRLREQEANGLYVHTVLLAALTSRGAEAGV